MSFLPCSPQKHLFQFWVDDSFIGKYGININNVVLGGANKLHYHDFFQIYYTVSGTYKDEINGVPVLCDEGSISLICPFTTHRLDTTQSPANTKVISFSFLPDAFSSRGIPLFPHSYKQALYNEICLPTYFRLNPDAVPLATELMCEIHSEYQKKSDMFLTKIFEKFSRFFELYANATEKLSTAHVSNTSAIYDSVSFIKEHFSENLTIDRAALKSAMARRSFTKLFREVTGKTYHDIFMTYRLMKAIELLRYTRKSISEISNELGFSSNAHFTKECIKMFTLPPLQLRREMMERTRTEAASAKSEKRSAHWTDIRSSDLMNEHYKVSIGKEI